MAGNGTTEDVTTKAKAKSDEKTIGLKSTKDDAADTFGKTSGKAGSDDAAQASGKTSGKAGQDDAVRSLGKAEGEAELSDEDFVSPDGKSKHDDKVKAGDAEELADGKVKGLPRGSKAPALEMTPR